MKSLGVGVGVSWGGISIHFVVFFYFAQCTVEFSTYVFHSFGPQIFALKFGASKEINI